MRLYMMIQTCDIISIGFLTAMLLPRKMTSSMQKVRKSRLFAPFMPVLKSQRGFKQLFNQSRLSGMERWYDILAQLVLMCKWSQATWLFKIHNSDFCRHCCLFLACHSDILLS